MYPTEYEAWKDSVWHSIKNLGTPLAFQQNFDFSWKIPINKIPVFSWITPDVSFNSSYNWNRGTKMEDGSTLGNTINNSRNINGNVKFNLETIYNSVPFLKKALSRTTRTSSSARRKKDDEKDRVFTQEVQLMPDTTITITHNKRSRKVRVRALLQDGKRYSLKYKVENANKITILNKDTVKLKVTIIPGKPIENNTWYKIAQAMARTAMMVRNISVTYKNSYNMSLPGFIPNIGDVFGQRSGSGLQPGLGFAFGFTDDSYIKKAMDKGWLIANDSVTTPATTNENESFQIRATVEPFRDFKIDLTASRTVNTARSIQYMFDGMPATQTGSFNITTISISSAFASLGIAENTYVNKTFRMFLILLPKFRDRVEAQYIGAPYPTNSAFAGKTFAPPSGTISQYSYDVMNQAILAA